MAALELAEAAVDTCGAKAAACGELARVAAASGGAFSVPWGVCLPFGAMEAALQACSPLSKPGAPEEGARTLSEPRPLNLYRGSWLKKQNQPVLWRRGRLRGRRAPVCPGAPSAGSAQRGPAVFTRWRPVVRAPCGRAAALATPAASKISGPGCRAWHRA